MTYCSPRNVFDSCMCEKLTIFPYGQDTVGNFVLLAFWRYSQVQDRSGVLGEMYKNITVLSRKMDLSQHAMQRWRHGDHRPVHSLFIDWVRTDTQKWKQHTRQFHSVHFADINMKTKHRWRTQVLTIRCTGLFSQWYVSSEFVGKLITRPVGILPWIMFFIYRRWSVIRWNRCELAVKTANTDLALQFVIENSILCIVNDDIHRLV